MATITLDLGEKLLIKGKKASGDETTLYMITWEISKITPDMYEYVSTAEECDEPESILINNWLAEDYFPAK